MIFIENDLQHTKTTDFPFSLTLYTYHLFSYSRSYLSTLSPFIAPCRGRFFLISMTRAYASSLGEGSFVNTSLSLVLFHSIYPKHRAHVHLLWLLRWSGRYAANTNYASRARVCTSRGGSVNRLSFRATIWPGQMPRRVSWVVSISS